MPLFGVDGDDCAGLVQRILILGAGTGGTTVANRLCRRVAREGADVAVTVVDVDDRHLYQPGLLLVPFGRTTVGRLTRSRSHYLAAGLDYWRGTVRQVDAARSEVVLEDETTLPYDVLVVATGAVLVPDESEGLTGPGWGDKVHTFYEPSAATALSRAMSGFTGGNLVVNVVDLPIKCPVAPLEFCFLADSYFRERGVRDRVELTYVTPLDAAFTRPVAAQHLAGLLQEKEIELVTEFNTARVEGDTGALVGYDDRRLDFDLAVVVPLHAGAAYVGNSPGLGDELNFVLTNPETLQATVAPNIFVIGDATDLPTSKAGSVAHFQAPVVVENIWRSLHDEPLLPDYDGHTNCFVDTGAGKALLIDFNYDLEPLPGHYPGRVGLPLLKESRLNHAAKLGFQWFYWHDLLPGHEIPGIHSSMPTRGKILARSGKGGT